MTTTKQKRAISIDMVMCEINRQREQGKKVDVADYVFRVVKMEAE
ncbi:hypothetical protein [Weissella muntiaci]|nr:hypothetical protein [Weissella muntiaci]